MDVKDNPAIKAGTKPLLLRRTLSHPGQRKSRHSKLQPKDFILQIRISEMITANYAALQNIFLSLAILN